MFDFGGEFVFFDLVVLDVGDQVFEGFVFIDNNKDLKIKLNRYNILESVNFMYQQFIVFGWRISLRIDKYVFYFDIFV